MEAIGQIYYGVAPLVAAVVYTVVVMVLLFGTTNLFAMVMVVFAFSVGLTVAQAIVESLAKATDGAPAASTEVASTN